MNKSDKRLAKKAYKIALCVSEINKTTELFFTAGNVKYTSKAFINSLQKNKIRLLNDLIDIKSLQVLSKKTMDKIIQLTTSE